MTAIGPGTRVKCIRPNGPWKIVGGLDDGDTSGPSFGSVWTVDGAINNVRGVFLYLKGWPRPENFAAWHFRPLDGDSELGRLREIAKEPGKVRELEAAQ